MRAKLAFLTLAAALFAPATAAAGGFATVGLSPPPDDIEPGAPWAVELEVLQHGRTPLEGVEPSVIVTGSGEREVFPARPTDRPGVYRAEVVFPSAGTWRYAVDDGFSQMHTFPPVRIGGDGATASAEVGAGGSSGGGADSGTGGPGAAGSNAGGGGPDIALALAIAAAAGLAAALAATVLRRRPRPG